MKQLTFNEIKSITKGAVAFEEKNGMLMFHRFTEAQRKAYEPYSYDFFTKCHATAGIRFAFATESTTLRLIGECDGGSSRKFFNFDVYVNGSLVRNVEGTRVDGHGEFDFEVALGEGSKNVAVYFPWSVQASVSSFSLDDEATVTPIDRPYKMISFGDSITHGYDAKNPSFSYASRLADALSADAINKGIGGEVFFPTLAELKDDYDPDFITVAYGTNDWSKTTKETFDTNSKLFYEKLSKNYPNAKIFALAPVWRGNYNTKPSKVGPFSYVAESLKQIAAELPNVTFIDCFDFIPHDPSNYVSDVLHPNDEGFKHYANNLYAEIKKHM